MNEHIPGGRPNSASLLIDKTIAPSSLPPVTTRNAARPFVFIHVGDLHITEPPTRTCAGAAVPEGKAPKKPDARAVREDRLHADLKAIFNDIASIDNKDSFDFVYLPGDLAENAGSQEYNFLAGILNSHPDIPVRLIPGDHDCARAHPPTCTPAQSHDCVRANLDDFATFRSGLRATSQHQNPRNNRYEVPLTSFPVPPNNVQEYVTQFNYAEDFVSPNGVPCEKRNDVRCIFLDLVSASDTRKVIPGLDFRLGNGQLKWLGDMLGDARTEGKRCAVFMHCYPADMRDPGESADVAGLIWSYGVKLVEMGHTHYNEICHDGRTQYAAARSVGQNEDGPTGYAVVAIDGDVTSWRFKQLQLTWPFVMITSPADRRLASGPLNAWNANGVRMVTVRALVLSDIADVSCICRVDHGLSLPMKAAGAGFYELDVEWPPGSKSISVVASDSRKSFQDFVDMDTIEPVADDFKVSVPAKQLGSDQFAIGSWPAKGVRGDQLGPNKSGHKW